MPETVQNQLVLHIEMTAEGKLNALLPDNWIIALGMLDYARERVMHQLVRPSFAPQVELATKVPGRIVDA